MVVSPNYLSPAPDFRRKVSLICKSVDEQSKVEHSEIEHLSAIFEYENGIPHKFSHSVDIVELAQSVPSKFLHSFCSVQ